MAFWASNHSICRANATGLPRLSELNGLTREERAMREFARSNEAADDASDVLEQIAQVLSQCDPSAQLSEEARAAARATREGRFTIVVLGGFNRGKSTLLNALQGASTLVEAMVPSTAVITKITYGQQPRAIVHFKDGRPDEVTSIEAFKKQYVLDVVQHRMDEDHPERADRFSHVDYAEFQVPLPLLAQRVDLVDAPGFDDEMARTRRARDFVKQAQAVVYVLDATMSYTDGDAEQIRWIRSCGKEEIFFVVNKWNLAREMAQDQQELDAITTRLRDKLAPFTWRGAENLYDRRVFFVNARGAKLAREGRLSTPGALEDSGVPAFERELEAFLVRDRREAHQRDLLASAQRWNTRCRELVNAQIRMRSRPLQELEAARGAIEPKLERLRRVRDHVSEFIRARALSFAVVIEESLRSHMRSLAVEPWVQHQCDLSEVEGRWIAGRVMTDLFRPEEERLKARLARQLEPQVLNLMAGAYSKWADEHGSNVARLESESIIAYVEREAQDYARILEEIHQEALGTPEADTPDPHAYVRDLVKEWLGPGFIHQGLGKVPAFNPSSFVIDLSPLMASILAEMLIHLKGFLMPVVGAIIALLFQAYRQKVTVDQIKRSIVDGLQSQIDRIPDSEQSLQIREQVRQQFEAMHGAITRKMNVRIAQEKASLEDAIESCKSASESLESYRVLSTQCLQTLKSRVDALTRLNPVPPPSPPQATSP
jgi:GTP-binding protein EngB required for normal cell division